MNASQPPSRMHHPFGDRPPRVAADRFDKGLLDNENMPPGHRIDHNIVKALTAVVIICAS
jgi:hypothetical protein